MTSFESDVDEDVDKGRDPYAFKITGQIFRWIRSICPEDNNARRFLQLYIYETENELSNRLKAFDLPKKKDLDPLIIQLLRRCLTVHDEYARTFKTAKHIADEMGIESYTMCLYNDVPDRRYGVPTPRSLGCIIICDKGNCEKYDIIIHSKSRRPQCVSNLHPNYMPLQ